MLPREELAELESGWESLHAVRPDVDRGLQEHFKLFNPQPSADNVLEMAGFEYSVEIHTDQGEAKTSSHRHSIRR